MTSIMTKNLDMEILADELKDLTVEQLQMTALVGVGKLAAWMLGGPKDEFQSGVGALGVVLHLIPTKLKFELAELTKESHVYAIDELIFLLSKSAAQIAQGDFYYGCAEMEYWLKYLILNFTEPVA